ncbi:MAG: phosphoribosylamine--glycine ligase, partial [Nanoarchaeota archaeon]|nr:phosphoribosylamine--glycine ligase [Nanoarchaeota archaeon]
GRVINVVGIGNTIKDAIKTAYKGTEAIDFDNKYLRNDIGYRALKKR